MSSPYVKVKAHLETLGYTVGKTEHWNPFAKIRQDLFNCVDLVAIRAGSPLVAIQVTSRTNVSNRMVKSQAMAHLWVSTGNRFEIYGYTSKSKKPPRVMRMRLDGTWEAKPAHVDLEFSL